MDNNPGEGNENVESVKIINDVSKNQSEWRANRRGCGRVHKRSSFGRHPPPSAVRSLPGGFRVYSGFQDCSPGPAKYASLIMRFSYSKPDFCIYFREKRITSSVNP